MAHFILTLHCTKQFSATQYKAKLSFIYLIFHTYLYDHTVDWTSGFHCYFKYICLLTTGLYWMSQWTYPVLRFQVQILTQRPVILTEVFNGFPHVPPGKVWSTTLTQGMTAFFYTLPSHPATECCVTYTADKALLNSNSSSNSHHIQLYQCQLCILCSEGLHLALIPLKSAVH